MLITLLSLVGTGLYTYAYVAAVPTSAFFFCSTDIFIKIVLSVYICIRLHKLLTLLLLKLLTLLTILISPTILTLLTILTSLLTLLTIQSLFTLWLQALQILRILAACTAVYVILSTDLFLKFFSWKLVSLSHSFVFLEKEEIITKKNCTFPFPFNEKNFQVCISDLQHL